MGDLLEDLKAKARQRIIGNVDKTLDVIEKRRDSADERISLDAAKYLCKLSGLEVDQVQHSGEITFTPTKFSHEGDCIQSAPITLLKGS